MKMKIGVVAAISEDNIKYQFLAHLDHGKDKILCVGHRFIECVYIPDRLR